MLVVADSSPLHYLILIEAVEILSRLYQQVLIPDAVASELSHPHAPQEVRNFIASPPSWLRVQAPTLLIKIDDLDPGEVAAISLALELSADLLLIDDLDGPRVAQQQGLKFTGVVGVLLAAADQGLIKLGPIVEKLKLVGLYLSEDLINRLQNHGE
jgi:predicted nucleic acid-binding protein